MDKFDEMMSEAVTQMGVLIKRPVENSESGMHDALACAFRKTYSCGATAVMLMSQWMWAHCEKRYHSNGSKAQ